MAELRMRIFSNQDKEQTLEELEEQINDFLRSVYQVERILQSGGDRYTTLTVCYWDRPSEVRLEADRRVVELEGELQGGEAPSSGQAGSGETLSHTHELASQGVRGLALEDGGLEHPGLDTTFDDLRHSSAEGFFPFNPEKPPPPDDAEEGVADAIAQSLAEELAEASQEVDPPRWPLGPEETAQEHALELHRLEDAMLTALERLTAIRIAYPLRGTEMMDFVLNEETLMQMVEQTRAAGEELASALREYALRRESRRRESGREPEPPGD